MIPDKNVIYRNLGAMNTANVYLLADVHLGAEECDYEAFQSLVLGLKKQKDAFVMVQGDMIDNGVKSSVTGPYGQTMRPAEQKREMAKTLEPIRDKILCIIPGNHEGRSGKEVDDCPAYDIASKLDLEDIYRENAAYLYLELGKDKMHDRPYRYYGLVQHGKGGGKKPGSTVNNADDYFQAVEGFDFLAIAHSHKAFALRGSKLELDPVRRVILQKPTIVMCANSWLNYGGYAIRGMYRPVAMPGANKITLYGDKKWFEAVT